LCDKAEAGDVGAAAEDRRLDERRAAGPHAAYLPPPEEPEHGDAEGGEGEAPRRPAELAAFHERVDERRATRDGQGDARRVDPPAGGDGRTVGQVTAAEHEGERDPPAYRGHLLT